jgi:hypothetical protein
MPKINLLKLPDPAAQTAKYVNMMNATRQQEAAERQAEMAQETLNLKKDDSARQEALQAPALAKAKTEAEVAQLNYVMDFYKQTANDLANSTTPEQVVARAERLKQQFTDPRLQARIDETVGELVSDPSQFEPNRKKIILRTLNAKDQFAENHSDIFDAEGNLYNKKTSPVGAFPTEITPGVVTGPANTGAAPAPAPRTPVTPAPAGAPMRATRGSNTTPQDLMQQGMDPRNIPSGMPTVRPASFTSGRMATPTAGQMSPDMVPAILDSAVQTGVMAQIDLDQMLALAPPQARQGIMDIVRNNNINLQADAPSLAASGMAQQQPMAPNPVQRPQAQFADMRGPAPRAQTAGLGGDMPMMRQTQAQYQVGQQIKGRNPNMPTSANVPLSRVAGEAEARRETPAQITARKNAELQATEAFEEANKGSRLARKREEVFEGERAKKDAAFVDSYSDATTKGRTTLNVIDQMIGDARLEKGKLVVPKGGRRPHPGFEGVVGMGVPGVRFIPGTQAASFDALFRQAEGGAFLQAYESLRGTGQITEIEGTKATSALTRMERSQSEAEFVKAAREFADVIRGAVDRADKRYTTLTGKAPAAPATRRRTPTKGSDGWGKAKVVGN